MAKVTGLRNWRNGEVINARDYVYERNLISSALNTNDDTLIDHETRITAIEDLDLDNRINAAEVDIDDLQAEEHLKLKYYGKATEDISKGDVVQFAGVQGDHYLIKKAVQSEVNANPKLVMGIAYTDIVNNAFGYVLDFGFLEGIDTKGFAAGTFLWFDSTGTTPGAWTTSEPNGENARVLLAVIVRAETSEPANNGKLLVRVTIEPSIDEIQGITITDVQTGDILRYNGTKWVNSNDLSTAEADILSLEGRMDTAESDIDTLQSDVSTLQGQGLDTRLTQAESDIDDIENTLPIKADLVDGKIPQSQLPSYVDDVLEVYVRTGSTEGSSDWLSLTNGGAALTPEAGKIYVIISSGDFEGKTYRWAGSVYSPVGDIALGTTSATAFPGDRGLAVETLADDIVDGTQTLTDTRITNSDVAITPLIVNGVASTTASLQEWKINNSNVTVLLNSGRIATTTGISHLTQSNSLIETISDGTRISRNVNDTKPALIVRKQQGTGNILELQTGTSDKKLEIDVNGWIYKNGNIYQHANGTNTTALGDRAARFGSSYSVAIGDVALFSTSQSSNTAIGYASLFSATSPGNTALGNNSGFSITSGSGNNTFVGNNSGSNASQLATASNSTAIGNQSYTDKSNQMVFGNASVTEFKFDRNASAVALLPNLTASSSSVNVLERTSSSTNTNGNGVVIRHTTSGDMADGFGSGLTFDIKDVAGVNNNIALINAIRSGADNSGRLAFSTANAGSLTEKITILPNGNVGIGTGSPVASLQIASPTTATYNRVIKIGSGSGTDGNGNYIDFPTSATSDGLGSRVGGTRTASGAGSDLRFETTDPGFSQVFERMRIRDNGNVGINETSPSAQLQVKSGATGRVPLIIDTVASNTADLQYWRVNGSLRAFILNNGNIGSPQVQSNSGANNSRITLASTGSTITRDVADTNPALIVNLANAGATGDILKVQKAGTDVYAFTHDGTLKAPATFTIDPSAHGDATGKVIILGDLQVDGTTTTINSTTLEVDDKNIELSKGAANKAASDGAGISIDLGTDGTADFTYGATNNRFSLNKGLEITSGNVGVGTITPAEPLTVRGNIRSQATNESTTNIITRAFSDGVSSRYGVIEALRDTVGSLPLALNPSGGIVGIGTTNPGTINGVAFSGVGFHSVFGAQGRIVAEGTGSGQLLLNDSGATANQRIKHIISDGGVLHLGKTTDGGVVTNHLSILDNGNVGIGTGSPSHQLTVNGGNLDITGGVTETALRIGGTAVVGRSDTTGTRLNGLTNLGLYITPNNTNDIGVRILHTGLVGINETSPSAQLQVKSGATNRVPLIVDIVASNTANLQEWKVNGTTVSRVNEGGAIHTYAVRHITSSANSNMSFDTNGAVISRNVADTNPALIVNLQNSSATGNIQVWQKAGSALAYVDNNGNFVGNNTEIVVYEESDSVRETSTYTTDLEITNLEANAYYEVEFVGAYYKTSTDSAGFRFGFTVSNTTGSPTLVGDAEVATNTTTGRLPSNIYAISSSIVTGSVLSTTPETATTTRRHALFKGVLYTGTSIKTLRLQTATSTTLTNGAVGLKAGSFLKVRKVS